MRILFHHRIRSKDGQFVHLEELVHAFRSLGHEVRIVGPEVVESASFGAGAGYVDALRRWLPPFVSEAMEFAYCAAAYPRLVSAITEFRPDFVYERFNLFFPVGVWAARRLGVPVALEVNAPLLEERSAHGRIGLARLARWSQRYVWANADLVLPVTAVLGRMVASYGVRPERIMVMPNGVDLSHFAATDLSAAKRALGYEGRIVLGFVGFVRDWHGVDHVVRLIASDRLPAQTMLLMVGDGPARADLERLASELGVSDRVRFTGVVEREALAPYIAAFDVALQPAVTAYASPLKVIEYLAMGKAIVAPDQENIREILEDGDNARLFPADDPAALADALAQLANDEALRARLGRRAVESIGERGLTWIGNGERIVAHMARKQRHGQPERVG